MTLQKRPAPISADLYDRFIVEVGRRIGLKEGAVKEALEETIVTWIKSKPKQNKVKKDGRINKKLKSLLYTATSND